MICAQCGKEFGAIDGYKLQRLDQVIHFCGRLCLCEWLVPEINKVCVPRQWIPTEEEIERMSQ